MPPPAVRRWALALLVVTLGAVAAVTAARGWPIPAAGPSASPLPVETSPTGPSAGPPASSADAGSQRLGSGQTSRVAGTGVAPFAFGTLETRPEHAAEESARGVKVAMMELNWSAYEPVEGRFDSGYARRSRDRLGALRAAGMRVTLGLGMHYSPRWLFGYPGSRFVDQHGRTSDQLNLVFNQRLRGKAERYLAQVDRDLGLGNFWAVRLNTGGDPEVLYPGGGSYWAFDANAQNGADRPPTMAANPLPGWRPGSRSVSTRQVQQWADWYVHGLDDVVTWQMRFIGSLGFRGYYQLLTPGAGTRPDAYARDVANFLPDGTTGVGAVWHRFYADLPDKRNVVAYVSSMADEPGRDQPCTPGDANVAITDRAVNAWPAARWIARVAREHGLRVNGENPGWNFPARLNAHYADASDAGMMAASLRQMTSCGFQGMYWAHDQQLWNGPVSFDRFARLIAAVNGSNSPAPPMP